jgi:hypothetical protein
LTKKAGQDKVPGSTFDLRTSTMQNNLQNQKAGQDKVLGSAFDLRTFTIRTLSHLSHPMENKWLI